MRSGQCPKCGFWEVHSVATIRNGLVVPLGILSMVGSATKLYVCVRCGYVEVYILDSTDLPKIAAKWPRVIPVDEERSEDEGRV